MAELAQVIALQPRSCFECENGALTNQGLWCLVFSEMILDERDAAAECPMYMPEGL